MAPPYSVRLREWWSDGGEQPRLDGVHYVLVNADNDREIVAYHQHEGLFAAGHYHLGAGDGRLPEPFSRVHLPAPGVALEVFVSALISEFRLPALRTVWRSILAIQAG